MDARTRILHEALRLFGSVGYEATSLQAIAEAVGMKRPSLLYHFASKEELHRAVVESMLEYWRHELPGVLTNSMTSHDRFDSTMAALLDFFRSDRNRARLVLREMLDRPEALRQRLIEHLSPLVRVLTDYLRMGQASGMIKPDLHPESYVVQVMMMVISTAAIGNVASAIVGGCDAEQGERDKAELVRIARQAAFVDSGSYTERV
jgi:AcrR family transcriptional regulator